MGVWCASCGSADVVVVVVVVVVLAVRLGVCVVC